MSDKGVARMAHLHLTRFAYMMFLNSTVRYVLTVLGLILSLIVPYGMEIRVDKSYYLPSAILEGVEPKLLAIAEEIITELRKQGFQAIIHNGMRTKAQAAANAARGVGILKSKHILGKALDIVDKRYWWEDKYLTKIKAFRKAYGALAMKYPELTWGGTWTKGKYGALGDWAHIEMKT